MKLTTIGEQYYGIAPTSDTLTWIFEDGAGTNGINRDPAQGATVPQTAVFNGKLYAAWVESNGSRIQARVAVYNGNDIAPAWAFVDGGSPASGLNKDPSRNADTPQLIVFNSKLYVAWSENNASTLAQIRVAVYNGSDIAPAWTFVDGNSATAGLNATTTKDGTYPRLAVFSGALYITWTENNGTFAQVHLYRFDETLVTWTAIDGGPPTGFNKNTSLDATNSVLVTNNNKLYAIWAENNGSKDQIRAKVYPSLTLVDGGGTNGLNKDPGRTAANPEACILNGKIYAVWQEFNATANQIRLAVYNGNDVAPVWTFVDGNSANGLNRDPTKAANTPHCFAYNSKLYLAWQETNSAALNQIRVAVYNGNDSAPSVRFADGGGDKGINKDTSLDAQNPRLNVFNSELFAIWTENNSVPRKQVRVASGL